MKTFFTFLLALSIASGYGQSVAKLDAQYGYKDLRFGMPVDSFVGKVRSEKLPSGGNGLDTYSITDPRYLTTGDCTATVALAFFFKGKLLSVSTGGPDLYDCLLACLTRQFGAPTQSDATNKSCRWITNKVTLILQRNALTGAALATYTCPKADAAYDKYCRKKKIKRYSTYQ